MPDNENKEFKSFGEEMKYRRSKAGLTQKELAEKAGLSTSAIQLYELGKRNPKELTRFKIAAALGMIELAPGTDFLISEEASAEDYEKKRNEQYKEYFTSMRNLYEKDVFILDVYNKYSGTLTDDQHVLATSADCELYRIIPDMIDIELDFLTEEGCRELQKIIYDMLKNPEYTSDEYKELLAKYQNQEDKP